MRYSDAFRASLRISVVFFGLSVFYIVSSDHLLERFLAPEQIRLAQSVKGTVYVAFAAIAIFFLTYRREIFNARAQRAMDERTADLVEVEKKRREGLLVQSIHHDMHHLMSAVRMQVQTVVSHAEEDSDARQAAQDLERLAHRFTRLHERLKPGASETTQTFRPDDWLYESLGLWKRTFFPSAVFRMHLGAPGVLLRGNPMLFEQMLLNLLLNAADASPRGGRIDIRTERNNHDLFIEICDDGPGIPTELLPEVWAPFFTTKKGGTGLGLNLVQDALDAFQGSIALENRPEGGIRAYIRLPIHAFSSRKP